ncbi:MAG: GNAT family N-acetyltransferase, partial [Verrucomicrobia bacterium]|nr:GNAT family N-acetyltransferase [Cytophagales bacterium]
FRGKNLVSTLVTWAKKYAAINKKDFVRLDTVGENKKLIDHYTNAGFNFLGLSTLTNTAGLPGHYRNATVSLFELPINK